LDDESTEDESIGCLEPPAVSPRGKTPASGITKGKKPAPLASTIILNSLVDNVSTLTEITMQAPKRRSEERVTDCEWERVTDCEQGMMQSIEM
jgi:hypothetical protein